MEDSINIKLRRVSRENRETRRSDSVRYEHLNSYRTEQDLTYFKDSHLKDLFVALFWHRPENVTEVLDEAVRNYPHGRFRIEQVRDTILRQYLRDGKLIF